MVSGQRCWSGISIFRLSTNSRAKFNAWTSSRPVTPASAMLPPLPEFQRFQLEFTSHIRDPRAYPCPGGVESHRMEVYARLVYSNVESFLLPSFPVVRHVLGAHRWAELVRNFLATHRSASPFFRQIPDEFIQFLQTQDAIPQTYPPFLLELAHYEWV